MNNLASFSVINQKVDKIYSEEKTENKGTAFTYLCLRTFFKLTDSEIEESITDGSMDGEIDAIYISNRVINLMTFKYTDRFDLSQKNFPGVDLDQFILTVDLIISGSLSKAVVNDALWEKYEEIMNLASTGKIEFKLFVISNKLPPVESSKIKLDNAIDKYRIVDKPIYYKQDDIVSKILENKTEKIDGNIRFIDKQHFEKSDGNIKSIIGVVAAKDLIDLVKIDDTNINENAFNENIRIYKSTHRVNKAIINSAISDDNFQFFYLNNGITILCEKSDYAPHTRSPLVGLTNFQVINGGQTSHSLFEVFKSTPDNLDTVEVLVRICEAQSNDPISDKISETSNNQIPVGSRDLHSNDLIQRKLEEDFNTLGYYYERKPNEYSDQPKEKVFNNELLGQLFMAYHLNQPSQAKNQKSKVFGELYDQIFDDKIINASELLRLHSIYEPLLLKKKEIQRKKRKKEDVKSNEDFITRAIFHIIYGVKLLYENEIFIIDSDENLNANLKKAKKEKIYKTKNSDFIKKSIKYIYKAIKEERKLRGDQYTHDKFFKETATNYTIKRKVLEEIKAENNV